jgi:hypothetical protein
VVVSPAASTLVAIGGGAIVTVIAWLALRRETDVDRQWAVLGMTALLLFPLGWTYYLPLFGGPLLLTCRRPVLAAVLLLLNIPGPVLASIHLGIVGTATLGSLGFWTTFALWCDALGASRSNRHSADLYRFVHASRGTA